MIFKQELHDLMVDAIAKDDRAQITRILILEEVEEIIKRLDEIEKRLPTKATEDFASPFTNYLL